MIQHSTLKILSALLAGALVSQADVVTDWNTAALNAIRATPDNPPRATRRMAIEHIAIFDAANGVQRSYRPYHVTEMAPAEASLEAAIAAAGYTTLNPLYTTPDIQTTNFLALYNAQLAQIPDGQAKTDGIAWGQSVAQAILDLRADDGWDAVVPYTPSGEVGRWKPTPPANAPALLPGWGYVTPFSMTSGAQFRPQPPPAIDPHDDGQIIGEIQHRAIRQYLRARQGDGAAAPAIGGDTHPPARGLCLGDGDPF